MALEIFAYKRHATVARYTGEDTRVVIPSEYAGLPVTEIRDGAFAANTTLEAVLLPKNLERIGASAFEACTALGFAGFLLEEGQTDLLSLPEDAVSMVSVLPDTLRYIGDNAFAGSGLQVVDIRSTRLEMGDSVFQDCPKLNMVSLFDCETLLLGTKVFMGSSLNRFYAPDVKQCSFPECTFANCVSLKTVMGTVRSVGPRCFFRCKELATLTLSPQLKTFGKDAFVGCDQLTNIPASAKKGSGIYPEPPAPPAFVPPAPEQKPAKSTSRKKAPKPAPEPQPEEKTEEAPPPSRECLFRMELDFRQNPDRKLPGTLKGIWGHQNRRFHFSIHTPSAMEDVGMRGLAEEDLFRFNPLLMHLVKNILTVFLEGRQEGKYYLVYNMLPAYSRGDAKGLSLPMFQDVLLRLKNSSCRETAHQESMFFMREIEEYETYLSLCQDRLPQWLVAAYRRNRQIHSNSTGSDDRRHALRAMELLMNIDWFPRVLNVPSQETVSQTLDRAFYGLVEVKARIGELIALIRRTGTVPKWGILLQGPAGVGKTHFAKAIAQLLDLPVFSMDMSTIGDSKEPITGSSRIYSNGKAGRLVEQMYTHRSSTGILLVNELDKATDSSCADVLLSILDKTGVYENYLEEFIPTENLLCIGTCNDLSAISKPMLDRFLVVSIPEYTLEEKAVIFTDYVLPKGLAERSIPRDAISLTEEAVRLLVEEHSLEPGVRDLERFSQRLASHYSTRPPEAPDRQVYTPEDIRQIFGPGKALVRHIPQYPGQVSGVFCRDGTAQFFILEASVNPGKGNFEVLGPVSPLQQSYCKAAYLCVRNTTGVDLSRLDVTVFIPHPIPEDPRNHLGLACYAAICSKLLGRELSVGSICFLGGCDMNGSVYLDSPELSPILRAMPARNLTTLYAPLGTARLVDPRIQGSATVVEGIDAQSLFALAASHSKAIC